MKLIDLLVQELPKHGGWPESVEWITQDSFGNAVDANKGSFIPFWSVKLSGFDLGAVVDKRQYEDALAASQQPSWHGDGLPPVGCECEVKSGKESWTLCKVVHSSSAGVAFIYLEEPSPELSTKYMGAIDSIPHRHAGDYFRAIRTKADRKREEIITSLRNSLQGTGYGLPEGAANIVFEAISAGKITGIRLED